MVLCEGGVGKALLLLRRHADDVDSTLGCRMSMSYTYLRQLVARASDSVEDYMYRLVS